jgi:hypothetical protein
LGSAVDLNVKFLGRIFMKKVGWMGLMLAIGVILGVRISVRLAPGNLYVAEVDSGRIQKFAPRAGANPAFFLAKPVYSAWK